MLTDLARVPMVTFTEPTEMPIGAIRVVGNVRDEVGDICGLVASIQKHGVIEPIIVTPEGELLAGQRRLAAAKAYFFRPNCRATSPKPASERWMVSSSRQ